MSENNADRVKKIIVSQLNVSEEQVTPEASFIDDLGADSLDQVELVMALEEEFGTEIPEEEAEKLQTVGSVISHEKVIFPKIILLGEWMWKTTRPSFLLLLS